MQKIWLFVVLNVIKKWWFKDKVFVSSRCICIPYNNDPNYLHALWDNIWKYIVAYLKLQFHLNDFTKIKMCIGYNLFAFLFGSTSYAIVFSNLLASLWVVIICLFLEFPIYVVTIAPQHLHGPKSSNISYTNGFLQKIQVNIGFIVAPLSPNFDM